MSQPLENKLIETAPSSRLALLAAVLIIVFAAGLAYSNSFHGAFVFDDIRDIIENSAIRSLWPSWQDFQASFGKGRPFIHFTLSINYALSRYEVWSYHLLNLLIHVSAALTLFGIVRRTLSWAKLRERYGAAATWLALACTLIWAVHPLHTQAVTYVIQRCESLMGLFFLLTLYCAIRGWQSPNRKYWHLGATAACLLGVGSKSVIAVAPIMVFLYDVVFVHNCDPPWQILRKSRLLYGGLFICLILLGALVVSATLLPMDFNITKTGRIDYASFTFVRAILTQIQAVFLYLHLTVWPTPLVFDYYWPFSPPVGTFFYVIVFGAIVVCSLWGLVKRRPWGFLWAWFLVILVPTSVFVVLGALTPVFEYRLYLPLAGLVVLAVIGAYEIGQRFASSGVQRLWLTRVGGGLIVLIVLILGLMTFFRNSDYQTAFSLWEDTVQKRPQNPLALNNLGAILKDSGKPQEALSYLRKVFDIDPNYISALYNTGVILNDIGRYREALPYLQKALSLRPGDAEIHHNLGLVLSNLGRPQEAVPYFQKALKIKPREAKVYSDLGVALTKLGRLEDAMANLRKALELKPNLVEAHVNLGVVFNRSGKPQEAIPHFQEALKTEPTNAEAYNNLGVSMLKLGQAQKALPHFQNALKINPNLMAAHANSGLALVQSGQAEQAVFHYREALKIQPNNVLIHYYLAEALLQQGKQDEAILHLGEAIKISPNFIPARQLIEKIKNQG